MRNIAVWWLLTLIMLFTSIAAAGTAASGVQVVADEASRRVDISIDGRPFTSYTWPATLKKPTLYPIVTDDGVTVTRGFPLGPRPGERADHPHHAGMWFNYGNANGFDFWNNSDAIKPADRSKMGTILQSKVVSTKSGKDRGELIVDSVWVTGAGNRIINQTTHYVFERREHARIIDQIVTLKALDHIIFHDDKEGVLGIRVARWLESPEEKGGTFTDANGNATKIDAVPNLPGESSPTGVYLTSSGVRGEAVWATRGRWCSLTGHTSQHAVTIAILDHPLNPGYPTYWHARGYGLFAANPLGRSIFDPKQTAFNFTIERSQSVTFRYRVMIVSHEESAEALNRESDRFASEYK